MKMEREQLNIVLKKHKMWLSGEENGKKADLRGADLSYADLRGADLRGADLSYADLRRANLNDADLQDADLRRANLNDADLQDADLRLADLSSANLNGANLSSANLSYANLNGANLSSADLRRANLNDADLSYADLRGADLSSAKTEGVKYDNNTSFYALQCPEVGSFTAFKKCHGKVVELFIPETAKRSSATSRNCRADKAIVMAIYNLDKTISDLKAIPSDYDESFIYEIGKMVSVKDFDDNRWNGCSSGIHFFITFDEAKQY